MSLGNIISAGGSSADRIFETVTQAAHGFAVLDTIYNDGTSWVKALSDNVDTVAQSVVTEVTSANEFVMTTQGVATVTGHGLTVGEYYWLSDTVAGGLQLTGANIAQSVLHVRDANTILVDIGQAIKASTGSTISYSTTEQDTGLTWIDGKTVYERTYDLAGVASLTVLETGIDLLIYEAIVQGVDSLVGGQTVREINTYNGTAFYGAYAKVTSNNIVINNSTNSANVNFAANSFATLRYTKI